MLQIPSGEILKVISSDKNSCGNISKFCDKKGHNLLLTDEKEGEFVFYIKKHD